MVSLHAQSAEKVLFGPFQLNVKTGELFEAGQKIRLSGQASQLVVISAQRPGQLVTREELRTALWHKNTFVDFGHGLNNCISRIREAIGHRRYPRDIFRPSRNRAIASSEKSLFQRKGLDSSQNQLPRHPCQRSRQRLRRITRLRT